MNHYGVSRWVDFARGLASNDDVDVMRGHLSEGCADCQDMVEFTQALSRICGQMETGQVPEAVLRNAKAIFPTQTVLDPGRTMRIGVRLIYDSLLSPEPAGLRTSWQVGWQALYRAGDCSLDLRVEPELSSSRAAVIGQISDYTAPENNMENIPVLLKAGRSVVAETRSNRFGEFQLEYEHQGRLQLCVYLENGAKRIQVPLKKLAADRSLGGVRNDPTAQPKADQE